MFPEKVKQSKRKLKNWNIYNCNVKYLCFKYRIREDIHSSRYQVDRKRGIFLSKAYGSYSKRFRSERAIRRR